MGHDGRNGGQDSRTPQPPWSMLVQYKNPDSSFSTIDSGSREEGGRMILETGDGSVSGLSENQDAEAFSGGCMWEL